MPPRRAGTTPTVTGVLCRCAQILGPRWKALSAEEKEKYEKEAADDKERYAREYKEYQDACEVRVRAPAALSAAAAAAAATATATAAAAAAALRAPASPPQTRTALT